VITFVELAKMALVNKTFRRISADNEVAIIPEVLLIPPKLWYNICVREFLPYQVGQQLEQSKDTNWRLFYLDQRM
jgi:hypothetical protein